jgi:hypothetical protein
VRSALSKRIKETTDSLSQPPSLFDALEHPVDVTELLKDFYYCCREDEEFSSGHHV